MTVLRTPRLLLRPFEAGDVDDALAYRNDEAFAQFLPDIPQPFTRADAERFVETNMTEPWDRLPTFAVVRDGVVIGTVNLELEPSTRTAMLGYAIGRAHWGVGLAAEAARAVLDWAFSDLGLTRVWASTDSRHLRSERVMQKLGMRLEESRPSAELDRAGQPHDEVVYAVTRDEWTEARATP
jgi:ribosomal-protein-alanine N-acetyltransferase